VTVVGEEMEDGAEGEEKRREASSCMSCCFWLSEAAVKGRWVVGKKKEWKIGSSQGACKSRRGREMTDSQEDGMKRRNGWMEDFLVVDDGSLDGGGC
jgi:hypothetical protein